MPRIVKLGLFVILGCAAVFGAAFVYLNRTHLDPDRSQHHNEYAASVARRDAKKESYAELVRRIKAAEAIADPRQRCLQYPDIPGTHWDPDVIAELCRVSHFDLVRLEDIEKLLDSNDAAAVDRIFTQYAERDATDPAWRGVWFRAFPALFEINSARVEAVVEKWVRLSPRSANALVARGAYRVNRAYELRGTSSTSDTPEESMAAMRKAMDDAVADLQAALKLDPKCKPAMIELMYAQKGNHDAVNRMGAQALATDPTDDMIYYVWMGAASPLWAGSAQTRAAERRIAILDAAQRYRDRYPLMAVVETRKRLFDHLRDPNATEILDKAPDLRAIEAAVNAGVEEPLAYATQLVRFEPSAKNYLFRREILMQPRLSPMLTNGWAQRDLASAALAAQSSRTPPIDLVRVLSEQGKNAEAAEVDRQVLQANPRDVQAIDQLIFLDIEGKNYDEAIQLGEKLVVLQPERSATWDMVAWTYLRVDMTKTCAALEKARELGGSGVLNGEERCTNEEALPDALKPKPH